MNLFDKKYQIFISSTYQDLVKAREEAIKVILDLYQIPIVMEMFSADNEDQWTVIKNTIDNSDYYILILGHRYGSTTKEGTSYTEKEFEYAKSLGVPILSFVRDENIATTPLERDTDFDKQQKLKGFREKVLSNSLIDFWSDEKELAQKISTALIKTFIKNPRIGWIRANQGISPEVSEEIAVLSKENRELKTELEKVSQKNENKKPVFKLHINNSEELHLEFKPQVGTMLDYLVPIDKGDFHHLVLEYYNPYEVEAYNSALREFKDEVDKYNDEVEFANRQIENATLVNFSVLNNGSSKANEVYTEITFPIELMIVEKLPIKSDLRFTKPKGIKKNPALEALNRLAGANMFSRSTLQEMRINQNFWVEANKLTIKHKSILHSRKEQTNYDLYIVPFSIGEFELGISYICEEFAEVKNNTFNVIVTEQST